MSRGLAPRCPVSSRDTFEGEHIRCSATCSTVSPAVPRSARSVAPSSRRRTVGLWTPDTPAALLPVSVTCTTSDTSPGHVPLADPKWHLPMALAAGTIEASAESILKRLADSAVDRWPEGCHIDRRQATGARAAERRRCWIPPHRPYRPFPAACS